jgi:hypothetical protein
LASPAPCGARVDFDATDLLGPTKDGVVTASDVAAALLPPDRLRDGVGARNPRTFDPVDGAAMLTTRAMLAYVIFVVALLCLPFGQPIVRRGRHVGDLLTQRWSAAA